MANGSGRQRFLPETRDEHRVVTHEIRQDYLDSMSCLEENMPGFKDNSHSSLAESSLQLIASIEYGLANKRWRRCVAVLGTVIDFVGETAPTGWTFFH